MIVHYFGQRKERRRQKRDQKPEQTKPITRVFLKTSGTIAAAIKRTLNAKPTQKRGSSVVANGVRS